MFYESNRTTFAKEAAAKLQDAHVGRARSKMREMVKNGTARSSSINGNTLERVN